MVDMVLASLGMVIMGPVNCVPLKRDKVGFMCSQVINQETRNVKSRT